MTETWISSRGDEARTVELAPSGFDVKSFQVNRNLVAVDLLQYTNLIALNHTSAFQSLGLLPYTGLLGTWLTLTVHHLLLNFQVFQSFHLLKRQTSSVTFCALY